MIPAAENWPRLVPYVVSAASVAVVGLAVSVLTHHVPLPHVSILFIAAVLTSAALWGFWPSMFAAVLSVAASAFFFYAIRRAERAARVVPRAGACPLGAQP